MPVFSPSSSQALLIANLFGFVLIVCAAILLLVTSLVCYSAWRFRSRPNQPEPAQKFGVKNFEIAWTIAPIVLLAVIFVFTLRTTYGSDPPANSQPDLVVTGQQWWWEARYPQAGFETANEIHVPAGKPMTVSILGGDVIHDFWVPQLSRKIDAIPGYPNRLVLRVDQPGTYFGACAEFCGAQHAWMRFRVVVDSPSDFETWQEHEAANAATPSIGPAADGSRLFQQLTCVKCHAVRGTDAAAKVGPDLTHFAGRQRFAAELLENTPANVTRWLTDPQALKPGCHMPNMQLTTAQIEPLVAYLETLQ